jgi:excisionase family DNA binding protein
MSHLDATNSADIRSANLAASSVDYDRRALGLTQTVYSVKEAMVVLGIGRGSIYRAINSGRLRVIKNGKRTIILAPDICTFLTSLPVGLHSDGSAA